MNFEDWERKLFDAGKLDLACAALVASGIRTERELEEYLAKMDDLCEQMRAEIPLDSYDDIEKAKAISDWLWKTKPRRYRSGGDFKLTKAIDAQLSEKRRSVGNCLGLTTFYNMLAQRFGLSIKAAHLEEAFGRGPHVFSVLDTKGGRIDIENIFPSGFDYKGHLEAPDRVEWGDCELVADIYHSVGNSFFDRGELEAAIGNYDKAIKLNPKYSKAYFNKGVALSELRRAEEASECFDKAMEQKDQPKAL